MIDWMIGLGVGAAVVAIIRKKIKDSKAGKSGCGCSCSGCQMKDHCKG